MQQHLNIFWYNKARLCWSMEILMRYLTIDCSADHVQLHHLQREKTVRMLKVLGECSNHILFRLQVCLCP